MTATTEKASSLRQRLASGHLPFFLRRLHSLTGILFGGFVIFHLLVNATMVEGYREGAAQTVYQKQVNYIHSIPFLALTEWVFIYLPIIYHTVYGLWLTYEGQPNINQYPYGKNIFYFFQRLSALVLAAFILFHVTAMKGWWSQSLKFDPWHATETTVNHLSASWFIGWFIYPVGILAACYHLANGFWAAAISWGLTVTAKAQRRWGWICFGLFLFTFACGMTALVAALTPAAFAHHP
jgi:succinate dehydrogenase cytochrome b subunit